MTNNKVTTVRFHMSGEGDIKAEHNRRDAETVKWEKHIDPNGKHEVIRDRDVVDVYEELFSDATAVSVACWSTWNRSALILVVESIERHVSRVRILHTR